MGPAEVFRAFAKLGVTAFGGPVAHLEYFRAEFVERRGWLTAEQYGRLVALCQFLPGPASSQVGFALGLFRGGWIGGLLAWVAFTLPSAAALTLLALTLAAFAGDPAALAGPTAGSGGAGAVLASLIIGLKAAAVAIVAHAVWSMSRSFTPDGRRRAIAVLAALLAMILPAMLGQIAAILVGALLGWWWCGRDTASRSTPDTGDALIVPVSRRAGTLSLVFAGVLFLVLPLLAATGVLAARVADGFYRAGALVFGGGHVVLPLLAAEPVVADGVASETFLAGYSAAQAVPGPLFTFAAYLGADLGVGAAAGSDADVRASAALFALIALVAVFLPGMLLLLGVLPWWNRLQQIPAVAAAMTGANAAVVGILIAALVSPIIPAGLTSWGTILIAVVALVLLLRRVSAIWVVALSAGAALAGSLAANALGWTWLFGPLPFS